MQYVENYQTMFKYENCKSKESKYWPLNSSLNENAKNHKVFNSASFLSTTNPRKVRYCLFNVYIEFHLNFNSSIIAWITKFTKIYFSMKIIIYFDQCCFRIVYIFRFEKDVGKYIYFTLLFFLTKSFNCVLKKLIFW